MKKIFFAAMPVVLLAMTLNNAIEPLVLGSPIPEPEIKMKDVSGKMISLQEIKTDKGLLVMFSCNTCPYVIKNQSRTKEACKYAADNGIGVTVINSNSGDRNGAESYDAMKEYAKKQSYNWAYLVDDNSKIADAFGASRTPECFLFDSRGKLVYHGAIDDNPSDAGAVGRKHLISAMDEMKAGKEISIKQSKSVGCGIKRPS